MKNIMIYLFAILAAFVPSIASAALQDDMIPHDSSAWIDTTAIIWVTDGSQWLSVLDTLAEYITGTIFWIIAIVAVGVFIYLWAKLAFARGNPEEFKNTMMWFAYAIVGILAVSLAWLVVRLVAGLDL